MRDLLDSLILLGAAQGIALAAALVARHKNPIANRILAGLVAALSLMLLSGVFEARWAYPAHPGFLGFGASLPFLFAPLLYLYVTALTQPAARFEARWLAHGVPFALHVVYLLQVFYLKSGADKLALIEAYHARELAAPLVVVDGLLLVQAIAYLCASWIALRRYARKMEGYFSDLARVDLRWLTAMVLLHGLVWSVVVTRSALRATGLAPRLVEVLSEAVQVATALVVFVTGYASLWQADLFEKARVAETARRPLPKYQRNRLDDGETKELARKLLAQMRDLHVYRDGSLTLQALADSVGATPHMVSQVLNLHLGKSFFVFVNSYRTEELMASLSDPLQRHRGVLELALDAGFNSKSTLNSFFKRYTGVTPTEFRQNPAPAKSAELSTG